LAFWSLDALRRLNPGNIPHLAQISIDRGYSCLRQRFAC
jgi:hypothetical protein